MNRGTLLIALVLGTAVILAISRSSGGLQERLGTLEQRIQILSQRYDDLAQRYDELASALRPDATQQEAASASQEDAQLIWRLADGLQGRPLRVAAKDFDQERGRVEVLLEIKAPLGNAGEWPHEPGQPLPLIVVANDATGAVAAERPMTLVRGSSLEPGAYLHAAAQLPASVIDRVRLVRIEPAAPAVR